MQKKKVETQPKKTQTVEKKKSYCKPKVKKLGNVRGVTAAGASGDFLC